MTTRAAIYLRVSTDEQAKLDHVSLAVQEARCRAYAASRDWLLVTVETDAESGMKPTRRGYQRVLDLARRGEIDVCVVYSATRWGRKASEFLARFEELQTCKVELVSTSEDLTNWLMVAMQAVLAENESRELARRSVPAKRHKAESGLFSHGRVPIGYSNDRGMLRPNQDAEAVRTAFQRVAGGMSMIDALGLFRASRPMTYGGFREMLRNPAYVGRLRFQDLDILARWEPLVDAETFARAGRLRYRPTRTGRAYWITGLAVCANCGGRMYVVSTVTSRKKPDYLICGLPRPGSRWVGCRRPNTHLHLAEVEEWVLREVARLKASPELIELYVARHASRLAALDAQRGQARLSLMAERERLERQVLRAQQSYLDSEGVFDAADVRRIKLDAEGRIAVIARELAAQPALENSIVRPEELRAFLSEGEWVEARHTDPLTFRRFLSRFVQRIELDRDTRRIVWAAGVVETFSLVR